MGEKTRSSESADQEIKWLSRFLTRALFAVALRSLFVHFLFRNRDQRFREFREPLER